jgi:hypothetical protein
MSRSDEFTQGQYDHYPADVRAGMYWADKRYGDQKELPRRGPFRQPTPYPETYEDHRAYEDERRVSRSE